jgi:ribosomal protein S18 acetylase RimI-like enzyme
MSADRRSIKAVAIRRASGEDWPQLWPIWHEVVAAGDTYVYDPASDSAAAEAMWVRSEPRHELWLAEQDGAALGMYKIEPNHDGPGAHVANGSYMVTAQARGLGVGRALVEHSLRRCTELGFLAIQFNAVAESNVGAILLYERLGFTTVGVVPQGFRHPERGLIGLRIMHRTLP